MVDTDSDARSPLIAANRTQRGITMRLSHLIFAGLTVLTVHVAVGCDSDECADSDGDDDCGNDGDETTSSTTAATTGATTGGGLNHLAGDSCTSVADCAEGLDICNDDPGGQCTKDCTVPADCSDAVGSICETERPGHCYHECTSKADCPRDGYDCLGGPNPEGKMWCDIIE
jgi:hypothetical protein